MSPSRERERQRSPRRERSRSSSRSGRHDRSRSPQRRDRDRSRSRSPHRRDRSRSRSRERRGRSQERSSNRDRERSRSRHRRRSPSPRRGVARLRASDANLRKYGKVYCRFGCAVVSPSDVLEQRDLRLSNEEAGEVVIYREDEDYAFAQLDRLLKFAPIDGELTFADADRVKHMKSMLDDGWSNARSDSNSTVGLKIGKWSKKARKAHDWLNVPGGTCPGDVEDKASLGFVNPTTARLLAPCDLDLDQPGIFEKLESGELQCFALPNVLFAGYRFNAEKPEEMCGAFRSPVFGFVLQCIYTGPNSAGTKGRTGKKGLKPTNAEIAGMTGMNVQSIAFAAIVVRHALSSSKRCVLVDTHFDYVEFYKQIVDAIEQECARPVGTSGKNPGDALLEYCNTLLWGPRRAVDKNKSLANMIANARRDPFNDISNNSNNEAERSAAGVPSSVPS